MLLAKNFKFHFSLSIPNKTIKSLPSYYKDIINCWCKYYFLHSEGSFLSFFAASYIKIDKVVCYKGFTDKKVSSDLFDENGELKSWQKILNDFQLIQKSYFTP